jgi:hypothetical protein
VKEKVEDGVRKGRGKKREGKKEEVKMEDKGMRK